MDTFSYLLGKQAGGSAPTLQSKEVTITENGTQSITPDTGYDGLSGVSVTTNVSGADLSEYFNTIINENTGSTRTLLNYGVLKLPPITITSKTRSLNYAFANMLNVQEINFSSEVDTSEVADMSFMFSSSKSLVNLDLKKINTSKVTNMNSVFHGCTNLINLDISSFDTKLVTGMANMFRDCKKIVDLDISNFYTDVLKNASQMFYGCTSLEKLDIRNFTFGSVAQSTYMFGQTDSTYVPENCLIIVKSDTEKAWINTNFPRMTNVKTVAEYEAE